MRILAVKGSSFAALAGAVLSIFLLLQGTSRSAENALPINIQGRITVGDVAFNGTGRFKFALVVSTGRQLLWTHDNTSSSVNAFEPTGFVELPVTKGVYSVMLGDTSITGMSNPINADVFNNPDVRLRVWFNDGSHGFQLLAPDQRVASVGYAVKAQRAGSAAVLTGNVTLEQVPSELVTQTDTGVNLTGVFTGDGSGLIGIRGSAPWQIAAAGSNDAFPNTGYLVTNRSETVIVLPATASMRVGDVTRVSGVIPGAWKIAQREGQSVFAGHFKGPIGASWLPRDTTRAWRGICASEDFTRLAAVVYNNGPILLSTNSGASWFQPPLPPTRNWRAIDCSADGMRLIAAAEGIQNEGSQIFISPDGGENWSARAQQHPGTRTWRGVASSANGTNLVAVSLNGPIYTSNDGGETWAPAINASQRAWVAVATSRDGTNILAAVSGERLYQSKDRGATWNFLNAGVGNWTSVASSADGAKLAACMDNGFVHTSVDGGANWTQQLSSGQRAWTAITSSADGNRLVAVGNNTQIYVSLDAGASWTARDTGRGWSAVTASADGTKFAATVLNGLIYVSEALPRQFTTPGTAGYLVGDQYSAVELQHIGEGKFLPLSSSGTIFAY